MSNITIGLEDIKKYIGTLSGEYEEWWMPEYSLYGIGIVRLLKTLDMDFANEVKAILETHGEISDTKESLRIEELHKIGVYDE